MSKIILYTRRNVGMITLSYLKGLSHKVVLISEDSDILWLAKSLNVGAIKIEHLPYHPHDLFLCVHGDKIIPKEYLHDYMVNIHPTKYNGHNPVKKYIANQDTDGCIRAMKMIEEVDAGELIHKENFITPVCSNYADFYNIAFPYYFKTIKTVLDKIL